MNRTRSMPILPRLPGMPETTEIKRRRFSESLVVLGAELSNNAENADAAMILYGEDPAFLLSTLRMLMAGLDAPAALSLIIGDGYPRKSSGIHPSAPEAP